MREADLDISDLLSNYAEAPLLLICEVQVYSAILPVALLMRLQGCIVFVIVYCIPHDVHGHMLLLAAKGDGPAYNSILSQRRDP